MMIVNFLIVKFRILFGLFVSWDILIFMLGFFRAFFFIKYLHFIVIVNFGHLKDTFYIIIFFEDRLYNL